MTNKFQYFPFGIDRSYKPIGSVFCLLQQIQLGCYTERIGDPEILQRFVDEYKKLKPNWEEMMKDPPRSSLWKSACLEAFFIVVVLKIEQVTVSLACFFC